MEEKFNFINLADDEQIKDFIKINSAILGEGGEEIVRKMLNTEFEFLNFNIKYLSNLVLDELSKLHITLHLKKSIFEKKENREIDIDDKIRDILLSIQINVGLYLIFEIYSNNKNLNLNDLQKIFIELEKKLK